MTHAPVTLSPAPVDIVLAAGGTGGHVFPAQALAAELLRRGRHIMLMTDRRGADYETAFAGVPVLGVASGTFARAGRLGQFRVLFDIARGILEARHHLARLRPRVVIGFGGYPSLPAMVAALSLGIPCCIHEQNAVLGRVNRLLAGRVKVLAGALPLSTPRDARLAGALVMTGNPVREAILAVAGAPYNEPGVTGPLNLLVTGGSQGASIMGDVVPAALAALPESMRQRLRVTQQVRPSDLERVVAFYRSHGIEAECAAFINDMPRHLASAHLVIARSGASTIAELGVVGRPAILVPLPSAMDDHQTANARALAEGGGAWLMAQTEFTAETLAQRLMHLAHAPLELGAAAAAALAFGRPKAASLLADLVDDIASNGKASSTSPRAGRPDNQARSPQTGMQASAEEAA
jgi:UDP-N-acetylglucosamine--N-acetylmuramyl-(pentapeptide) pyrophosphoryl-undecaprenol N-acetylglucosamine transferase